MDQVDMGDVLAGLAKSGRLSKNDKRWVTSKLESQNRHQRNMQFLKTLEVNQDLPFILMFLGGTAGAAIIELTKKIETSTNPTEKKTYEEQLASLAENFLDYQSFMMGGVVGWIGQELVIGQKMKTLFTENKPVSWVDYAACTASSLSIGIAAFGASILTMRAVFGNSSKDGGFAQLAGLGVL